MKDELMEIFVDYHNGFTELLKPADRPLKDYLHELNVLLPKGFRTEINRDAIDWIKAIASSLKKGYVMTIDYGHTTEAMYKSCRSYGTLLCYHQHQITDQPYQNIGKQDITSHVNFSSLCHWGLKNGLAPFGLTSQSDVLLALGFKDYLRNTAVSTGNIVQLAMNEIMLTRK